MMTKFKNVFLTVAVAVSFPAAIFAASNCEFTIEGTDTMSYAKDGKPFSGPITAGSDCKEFKLTLKHTGKMPKTAMGHNWVLAETKELAAITADAAKAGPSKDYKPSAPAVLAITKLLAGGESDTITFAMGKLKKGGDYTYFCTFPGHSAIMKGKFEIK